MSETEVQNVDTQNQAEEQTQEPQPTPAEQPIDQTPMVQRHDDPEDQQPNEQAPQEEQTQNQTPAEAASSQDPVVITSTSQADGEQKEPEHASFFTAVISLVNSTLGSGMLGIPLAYSKAGLVPAIILHVLMGVMSWASFYFLTYASEATGVYSYGDVFFFSSLTFFLYSPFF